MADDQYTPAPGAGPAPAVRIGARSSDKGRSRKSLPIDTSVRYALFTLAQLCDAKEDATEIEKVVQVMFQSLPMPIRTRAGNETEYDFNVQKTIDLICQGFQVRDIVAVLLVRMGMQLSAEDSNAVVRSIEADVIVHMGLSRDAGQSDSYGALCEAASVVTQYGTRMARDILRTYSYAVRASGGEAPECVYKFHEEARRIAAENTEGSERSVDGYYKSLGRRILAINNAAKVCKQQLADTYPDVDPSEPDAEAVKQANLRTVAQLREQAERLTADAARAGRRMPPAHPGKARAAAGVPTTVPETPASAPESEQVDHPVPVSGGSRPAEPDVPQNQTVKDPDSGFILTTSADAAPGGDGKTD